MRKRTQWGEIEHQSCQGLYVTQLTTLASILEKGTHCHTAIHRASLRGADEEEGYSRDKHKGSNYTNVLHLELVQIFSLVLIEDNKEDVASHSKCPEYIC